MRHIQILNTDCNPNYPDQRDYEYDFVCVPFPKDSRPLTRRYREAQENLIKAAKNKIRNNANNTALNFRTHLETVGDEMILVGEYTSCSAKGLPWQFERI